MKISKHIIVAGLILILVIVSVLIVFHFGWKVGGFANCVDPNDYLVLNCEIQADSISILYEKGGFYCTPILGYICETDGGTIKLGIKYYTDYSAYIYRGTWCEELVIPCSTDRIDKILLCGDGVEIDIQDRYSPEAYRVMQKYIQ